MKNVNTKVITIKSCYIFGERIICSLLLPYVYTSSKASYKVTLADFKKHPAFIEYSHGDCQGFKRLDSLIDKKILLGSINASGGLDEQLKNINIDTCLALFDKINLDIDISKTNLVVTNYKESKLPRIDIVPLLGRYQIGKKQFTKLCDDNILSSICSVTKVYKDSSRDSKYGFVTFEEAKYKYELNIREDINEYTSKMVNISKIKALRNWKNKVDTSGSLKNKKDILRYLNVGDGYIAVSSSIMRQLAEGKHPSSLTYRDACSKQDKLAQPINLGTSGKIFFAEDKNGIVVGYSDKFVDSLFND